MFFSLSKIFTFIIDPLFLLFCIGGVALFFPSLRRKIRWVLLPLFILIFIISTPFMANRIFSFVEDLETNTMKDIKYDAIVVLSGMVNLSLSNEDQIEFSGAVDRILKGVELYKQGKAEFLILSGGSGALFGDVFSEAELLKKFIAKFGIPSDRIIVEANSRNTYQNAIETAKIINKHGYKKILLITSAFHMFRSHGCFTKVGIDVDLFPVDYYAQKKVLDFRVFLPSSPSLNLVNRAIHELTGILVYWATNRISY